MSHDRYWVTRRAGLFARVNALDLVAHAARRTHFERLCANSFRDRCHGRARLLTRPWTAGEVSG